MSKEMNRRMDGQTYLRMEIDAYRTIKLTQLVGEKYGRWGTATDLCMHLANTMMQQRRSTNKTLLGSSQTTTKAEDISFVDELVSKLLAKCYDHQDVFSAGSQHRSSPKWCHSNYSQALSNTTTAQTGE